LAIILALKSVSPPALAITTTCTGRLGQLLASAAIAVPAVRLRNEAIKEAQSVFFIIVLRVLPFIGGLKLNEKRTRPLITPEETGEGAWVWKSRFGSSCEPARGSWDRKESVRRTALKRETDGLRPLWAANAEDMAAPFGFYYFLMSYVVV
jgi:hypothetical protein